ASSIPSSRHSCAPTNAPTVKATCSAGRNRPSNWCSARSLRPTGRYDRQPGGTTAQSLAMDTSVDLTKAITSLPTPSSSSLTERVVITEVITPDAVCASISDNTSPSTISLMVPLNWLRTLMALMVMVFLLGRYEP